MINDLEIHKLSLEGDVDVYIKGASINMNMKNTSKDKIKESGAAGVTDSPYRMDLHI